MEESLLPSTKTQPASSEGSSATEQSSTVDYRLWVSVGVSVVAVIFAIVCLSRTRDISVQKQVFSIDKMEDNIKIGDVVSLDKYGNLKQGAGTSLYRNIQTINNKTLYHLHTVAVGETIHVAQYDSEMLVSVISPETDTVIATETFDIPLVDGKSHRVDDLLVIEDNIVLSLGDTAVIPSRVSFEDGKINVEWGEMTHPTNRSSIQPEFVTLNKSCVIMSYYGVDNRITAVAGCMDDVETMHMRWGEIVEYSEDYIFHDIIGLTGTRFIVTHARVPWWAASNGKVDVLERQRNPDKYAKKPDDSRLRYGLGIVHPDLSVEIPEIKIINKDSFGFMDMAQLDESTATLTFIYEQNNNGMQSILFKYDNVTDKLYVASSINHNSGGGSSRIGGLYSFIRSRTFSPTRFGIYYSSAANYAATLLSIAEVTPAGGLTQFGPEFMIAPPVNSFTRSYYWTNLAPCSPERFFVMESVTTHGGPDYPHANIHVGEVFPTPLGIVSDISGKKVTVVVDGELKVTGRTLKVGKEYMANSRGELVEGDYVGEMNSDSYPIYVQDEKENVNEILTTENQVGYAIAEDTLFVRIPDYIEV